MLWCLVCFVYVLIALFDILVVTQAYDNVALNKPAYQLYPYDVGDSYDASNAVDGLISDFDIDGGQCVGSDTGRDIATWRVDLGSIYYIDHIFLYFMTENIPWDNNNEKISSFLGFSLFVSNTTSKVHGKLCFKDNGFTKSTIPPIFNTSCHVFGRHVIYYNERLPGVKYPDDYNQDAENDLCEVEVYGCPTENSNCDDWDPVMCACLVCKPCPSCRQIGKECAIGHYGQNCSQTCGECIDPRQCSPVSGTCLTGCKAGYTGSLCTEVCEFGYYGYGCHQECSIFCNNGRDCHHVSGVCKDGCSNRGVGPFCLESSVGKENNTPVSLFGIIGVLCFLIIIIGALIFYIFWIRISSKESDDRQQQNIEMKETYQKNCNARRDGVVSGQYLEVGEINYR